MAVNVKRDQSNAIETLESKLGPQTLESLNTRLLPVHNWGGVTPALNEILKHVRYNFSKVPTIVFQSVEVHATLEQVNFLTSVVQTDGALVAGGVLNGHSKSRDKLASRTPWNTLAAWNLALLSVDGFPAVADTVSPPGMEEVAAITAIARRSDIRDGRVVLVEFQEGIQWDAVQGANRMKRHLKKMESKEERAWELVESMPFGCRDGPAKVTSDYRTEWIVCGQCGDHSVEYIY